MSNMNDFVIEDGVLKKYKGKDRDVVIPNNVTSIGQDAFNRCYSLKTVMIPDGVTSIGGSAFAYCGKLASVTIPYSVTYIGSDAFFGCDNLTIRGYIGTAAEKYANDNNIPFIGSKKSIKGAVVSGIVSKTYTGKPLTQSPTVKVGSKTLKNGTDYALSYKNNTNTGTATVSITGAKGTKSYKSSDTTIATVTAAGRVTARKVGTVKITAMVAATANYKAASKTVTIKVVPASTASLTAANQATGIKLTWKKVTGANGYKVYRGSTLIKTITSGSTVTFADTKANTNGTKYTYKVVAKAATGDSTLSKSVAVYRVARPAISSVTNSAASKMTVKWGKNAKANGYQIQYSLSSSFASGNKAVTVTGASTVTKVIGSLTKGKTYYVRIRTYKTVGSTKYWSFWSSAKRVKISK